MLAIPYLTETAVVNIRFRQLGNREPKYLGIKDSARRLYNARTLLQSHETVVICEGELDAVVVEMCGVAAVAAPGVQGWRPHYTKLLASVPSVIIATDNDVALSKKPGKSNDGQDFASFLKKEIPHARIVVPSADVDISALYVDGGISSVLGLLHVNR